MQLPDHERLSVEWIVLDEAGVAGRLAAHRVADGALELHQWFVRPAWRTRGAGRTLLDAAIKGAKAMGSPSLRVFVGPAMAPAVHALVACGFRPVPPFRPVPESWGPITFYVRLTVRR